MKTHQIARYVILMLLFWSAFFLSGCGSGGGDDDPFVAPEFNQGPPPRIPTLPTLQAYYDSYEGRVDTVLFVNSLFGVLANDDYPEFDTVIEYPSFTVNGGALDGYQNGAFEYDPPAGFTGQDSFTYTLRDGEGRSSSTVVYINVYLDL